MDERTRDDDRDPAPGPGDRDAAPDPDERESAYELLQRGQALLAGRHHAQAAIVLARAARLEPGRGSILEPLGRACFMAGQVERAAEAFEALLVVDPSSHYGHYALGRSLIRLGRVEEGRTHLRLAAALAPDNRLYRGGLRRLGAAADRREPAGDREATEEPGGAGE
ncbi:MAG: tetratricopeptide repeat protein [Chloroflexi bacterium]|nr:tetratricopeptide repeat protein [Chloroflexota bacterium]